MNILARIIGGVLLVVALPMTARAQSPTPGPCVPGELKSGALSLICVPSTGWNHDLVVFAHGYVDVSEPIGFYNLTLADGTSLPVLLQSLGFAFATTSYRQNGLTILQGVDDIRELVDAFNDQYGKPNHTYDTGVSEGGLVAALLAESHASLFTGALATCGPIGSFTRQIDYFGDFRVLFDYFFPGLIPGSPIDIPSNVITNWYSVYVPAIQAALIADLSAFEIDPVHHPSAALELLKVSGAAYDPANLATVVTTTLDVLWYDIFATNDAAAKLGGNPYDNHDRYYNGSTDDAVLNAEIERFTASPRARARLHRYETHGDPHVPLVALHTTGDDVIPFEQEQLYEAKVHPAQGPNGASAFDLLPIVRYGHCNFTSQEILGAFELMVEKQ